MNQLPHLAEKLVIFFDEIGVRQFRLGVLICLLENRVKKPVQLCLFVAAPSSRSKYLGQFFVPVLQFLENALRYHTSHILRFPQMTQTSIDLFHLITNLIELVLIDNDQISEHQLVERRFLILEIDVELHQKGIFVSHLVNMNLYLILFNFLL